MDINQETILDALNDFERKPTEIPPVLDEYLLRIARNGEIIFPWGKLKPLLKRKLEVVCDEFNATTTEEIPQVPNFDNFHYETLKKSILQAVEAFTSAPFTIQRLCELVTNPKKHYNRTDKYMRGLEKNVLVVSTIEPRIGTQNDSNANVSPVVNGMITDSPTEDNECYNSHESNENVSSSNLNTPANHVLLDNFANVFPSAACIPSPSNICMNREIDSLNRDMDSNFIQSSECVQNQDEFAPQVSLELSESSEPKDEQMDTSNEEQGESSANDTCEVSSAEPELVADSESSVNVDEPEEVTNIVEQIDNEVTKTISTIEDDVSASEDVKSEADCSESHSEISTPESVEKEFVEESNDCQQDDTVSQSDDNQCDVSDVSQSDEICETTSAATAEETAIENTSESEEVSQSVSNSDSSEQCLELGSSSSEEPSL